MELLAIIPGGLANCKPFGGTIVGRRRWNPARSKTVEVRGGLNNSSSINTRDRVTATGQEYAEASQPGDEFLIPRQGQVRAARRSFDEEDYATVKNLRHSQQKPAGPPSSALTSIALTAIPLLLIAPVVGFIARCVVDYIHAHIEQEVGKRFAEMESWQARRRPRVKRWQTILDEDRDEDELEPASSISEYQYQSDPWSMNGRQLATTTSKDNTEMEAWHEKETEEERKMRQRYDYEQIKRSYTRLEPMYDKFLADSGLSASGYWRGAGES